LRTLKNKKKKRAKEALLINRSFLIVGAGSWGTAVAIHLAQRHKAVFLWTRDEARLAELQLARENAYYLPGIPFPPTLKLTSTLIPADNIIVAVPSHAFRETLENIKPYYAASKTKLLWLTKGLDPLTHRFLSETAEEILGKQGSFSILSGPSFAKEVAQQMPTAVTLAGDASLTADFHAPHFRVYFSKDITGVQLGGATKNVLAIAVGIAEGLGCGANAQAALITRGLSEIMRLGHAVKADPATLMGLSGLGDLILTCTNNQSRNRRFGIALGQGSTKEIAEKSIGQVVEGIQTAKEIQALAHQYTVEMPITQEIYRILYEQKPASAALNDLLTREPKAEHL
jgi:glycerol-3-phosphate dehydrogenase (NAD(P)+)